MSNDGRFALAHELVREYAELEAQMAERDFYKNSERSKKMSAEYVDVKKKLEEIVELWGTLSEEIGA